MTLSLDSIQCGIQVVLDHLGLIVIEKENGMLSCHVSRPKNWWDSSSYLVVDTCRKGVFNVAISDGCRDADHL